MTHLAIGDAVFHCNVLGERVLVPGEDVEDDRFVDDADIRGCPQHRVDISGHSEWMSFWSIVVETIEETINVDLTSIDMAGEE